MVDQIKVTKLLDCYFGEFHFVIHERGSYTKPLLILNEYELSLLINEAQAAMESEPTPAAKEALIRGKA